MNKLWDEPIFNDEHGPATKVMCIIAPIECSRAMDIFNKKRKYFYDRCLDPCYLILHC